MEDKLEAIFLRVIHFNSRVGQHIDSLLPFRQRLGAE